MAAALNCPARFPSLTVVSVEAADERSLRFATALLLSPLAQRRAETVDAGRGGAADADSLRGAAAPRPQVVRGSSLPIVHG